MTPAVAAKLLNRQGIARWPCLLDRIIWGSGDQSNEGVEYTTFARSKHGLEISPPSGANRPLASVIPHIRGFLLPRSRSTSHGGWYRVPVNPPVGLLVPWWLGLLMPTQGRLEGK